LLVDCSVLKKDSQTNVRLREKKRKTLGTRKLHIKKKKATPLLERRHALEHTKEKKKTKQLRTTSHPAKPASQRS
jgi:hypothetical protein